MRSATVLLALLVAAPAPTQSRNPEPFETAVDRGLDYLARAQTRDGGWTSGFGTPRSPGGDPALTALAVLAFLSAGHVPGEGKYAANVERGIQFVMNSQQRNGLIARPDAGSTEMYSHGICTLMLAEAVGMTDGRLADDLKRRLEAAVKVILKGQREGTRDGGGWRYQVTGFDADLSVTGWQLVALRAARNAGCDVPPDRIAAAVEYVKRCHDARSGGYAYTVGSVQVTPACTGTGILAVELSGKEYHQSHEALRAGAYLLRNPPDPARPHFYYGVYYSAQAMFQLGDAYWTEFRRTLHASLLQTNPPRSNGAWYGRGFDDANYGPAYCTTMAVLALTVEYRYLPIYQREEESERRGGK